MNQKRSDSKADIIEEINLERINQELNLNQSKLTFIETDRERILAKKKMLVETLEKYNKIGKRNIINNKYNKINYLIF